MQMATIQAGMTQNSFVSFTSHLSRPVDGYQTSTANWRINTGFKKLQRRINERHKSGKSSTSAIKNRSLPPITGDVTDRKKTSHSARDQVKGSADAYDKTKSRVTTSRTMAKGDGKVGKGGQSEFSVSLQYELYRQSNNGLNRISARMKKSMHRISSQTSLEFSDSSFEANEEEMCSTPPQQPQQTPQTKLPAVQQGKLLKQEVQKLDKQHHDYYEEELEDRIIKWIKQCKMWNCYDGSPYDDLDRKLRKKCKQTYVPSSKKTHDSHVDTLDISH